jgi:hypothetical protein
MNSLLRESTPVHRRAASDGTIETTVGDLIAALVEEVKPYVRNERETNALVSYILMDLCQARVCRGAAGIDVSIIVASESR